MTIEEKREEIHEAVGELSFEEARMLSAFLTGLEATREMFPAEETKFRGFEVTAADLEVAKFFLYGWGRCLEQGCVGEEWESLRSYTLHWKDEAVRALAAAYMAVLREMRKKIRKEGRRRTTFAAKERSDKNGEAEQESAEGRGDPQL